MTQEFTHHEIYKTRI